MSGNSTESILNEGQSEQYKGDNHENWNKWQTASKEQWAKLKSFAIANRKIATAEEDILWQELRNRKRQVKFRRQHAIGMFITDFVCLDKQLVVEVDGDYHNETEQKEYDEARSAYLNFWGFSVLRFSNQEVHNNLTEVLNKIDIALEKCGSIKENLRSPLSSGEGPGVRHYRMEYNTMPGWAGSSWYFLRYMDPRNENAFADRSKVDYWNQVDLYMGGAEHATGHLLYSRFWTKILFDHGYIGFDEPFKKMINQGMIQGRSNHVYRINGTNQFVTAEKKDSYDTQQLYVDINLVDNDILDTDAFKKWLPEYHNAEFILNEQNQYKCTFAIDKMSKRWFNVANPDDLCEKYGADTLRLYEMFLGPVEQSKPWDTKGISGVHNFLRKFWRLAHDRDNNFSVQDADPSAAELRVLHTAIRKVTEDLNRYSWNTVVSTMMICVNELTELKSSNKKILSDLVVLLSPYAPHFAEEIWEKLGQTSSVVGASWPAFDVKYLVVDSFDYPVSFNGKTRFNIELGISLSTDEVTKAVLNHELTAKYLEGKQPKKVIVVPKRIVNVVV